MADPEWDEDTRALALGFDQMDLCAACGGPAFLCQDPENQYNWKIPPPVRCHRTTALRVAQRKVTEETNPVPEALLWRSILNAGAR